MNELLTPSQAEVTEENRLRSHVQQIVHNIENGFPDELGQDDQPFSAFDYLQDVLDIEYVVSSDGKALWIQTGSKRRVFKYCRRYSRR